MMAVNPQVKAQNPSMTPGQIIRQIGKQWLELPAHERQPYLDVERQMRERYNQVVQGHEPSVVAAVLPLPMGQLNQIPIPQISMNLTSGRPDIDLSGQISAPAEHIGVPPPQAEQMEVSTACLPPRYE
eukprot:TRINITY_DN44465_c0_g1_i1.p2 TRINITY_DN44465_c0_g1~~TRINITY_DN44465_c0_g1_i1.p2  ORF type:complete len:128 (+),score=13.69 TRINITY_DN44465_c0_g1_i1:596-979(+)